MTSWSVDIILLRFCSASSQYHVLHFVEIVNLYTHRPGLCIFARMARSLLLGRSWNFLKAFSSHIGEDMCDLLSIEWILDMFSGFAALDCLISWQSGRRAQTRGGSVSVFCVGVGFRFFGRFYKSRFGIRYRFFKNIGYRFGFSVIQPMSIYPANLQSSITTVYWCLPDSRFAEIRVYS